MTAQIYRSAAEQIAHEMDTAAKYTADGALADVMRGCADRVRELAPVAPSADVEPVAVTLRRVINDLRAEAEFLAPVGVADPNEISHDDRVKAEALREYAERLGNHPALATPAAQSATVDDTALIERAAIALARGDTGEAKWWSDDAHRAHEQVYGPLLAAKAAEVERLRGLLQKAELDRDIARAAGEVNRRWSEKSGEFLERAERAEAEVAAKDTEVEQIRADLAERTRERDERFRSVVHQCCEDVQTLRAELERERNPNVELSLANRAAFSASLAAVQARYADGFKLERDEARAELAALRAHQDKTVDLLNDLADPDPCQFDHHGGCQAHGYLSLAMDEQCPVQEAKDLIESWRPAAEPAEATESYACTDECRDEHCVHPIACETRGQCPPQNPALRPGDGFDASRPFEHLQAADATPAEPRVFRAGDTAPDSSVKLRDSTDGFIWETSLVPSPLWANEYGQWMPWERLVRDYGPLAEVPTKGGDRG